MSFWSFSGELALLEWPFGSGKRNEAKTPPSGRPYNYDREDGYLDKVYSLESRIDELERQQTDVIYSRIGMISCKTRWMTYKTNLTNWMTISMMIYRQAFSVKN